MDGKGAMGSTRITSDMVKPFNGEGDVVVWLKKVELVAKLTKVTDEACFIPLYLEGGALSVYMEMSDEDQKDASKIKEELKCAFSDSVFVAYTKMTGHKWSGESVDVYANELRRLAGLAGFKSSANDHVVKLAFVTGFPDDVSVDLQQFSDLDEASLADLIYRARILVANRSVGSVAAVSAQQVKSKSYNKDVYDKFNQSRAKGENENSYGKGFNGKCFRCQGPHMIRNCPEKGEMRGIICYRCGEEGHIATKCTAQKAGNE